MENDEFVMKAVVSECDALDITRVHEQRNGKWETTTIICGDEALLRIVNAAIRAAAPPESAQPFGSGRSDVKGEAHLEEIRKTAERTFTEVRKYSTTTEPLAESAQTEGETDAWSNEAATVMADFITLSAHPDEQAWGMNATEAARLLNIPKEHRHTVCQCPQCGAGKEGA